MADNIIVTPEIPTNPTPMESCILIGDLAGVDYLKSLLQLTGKNLPIVGWFTNQVNRHDALQLGLLDDLDAFLVDETPTLALVSLPAAMHHQIQQITQTLKQNQIPWRYIPNLDDQLTGKVRTTTPGLPEFSGFSEGGGQIDTIQLISREPQPLDEKAIKLVIENKAVLLTGAGGSIGSELARIVCRFKPSRLMLVERSENSLFEIDRRIAREFPDQKRHAILHDITDPSHTLAMMGKYKPDVIFHAAAHKHVPMMEGHPSEAVENNFFGTRSVADAANALGVGRFVMISSDKAVNPSSVMGATKRMAERYIQWLNSHCDTVFSMVRFGNVLGSACSVLPIWSSQLAQGGPLTVTHQAMTRYFMTIPEAAGLVIQSAAYASGGEVFLLDMGQPVNILELCKRFVRMHGLEPDVDMLIKITGIRPGEKLFEELAYDCEAMLPTPHASIRLWETLPPMEAQMQQIIRAFDTLRDKRSINDHHWQHAKTQAILAAIRMAVPEMIPSSERAIAS
ncbi:MAG: polysaccharide biosynthesis protein [Phycisphaeraceae bacterium]|nr:polysaccharide biosynthesis protein [Phycisphaeraceae bacterium]